MSEPLTQAQILKLRQQSGITEDSLSTTPNPGVANMARRRKMLERQQVSQPKPGFLERAGTAIKDRLGERFGSEGIKKRASEVFGIAKESITEQSPQRKVLRAVGTGAREVTGIFGDVIGGIIEALPENIKESATRQFTKIAQTSIGQQALEAFDAGTEAFGAFEEKFPKEAQDIKDIVAIAEIAPAGFISKPLKKVATKAIEVGAEAVAKGTKKGVELGAEAVKRTFDTALSVPERIRNVRSAIGKVDDVTPPRIKVDTKVSDVTPDVKVSKIEVPKVEAPSFKDNPTVSGALEDIKIMVGLPGSTPSADLAFKAIRPSAVKNRNLGRIKAQIALANETIAQKGLSPKAMSEYADSIFETKKDVWSQIQSKLDAGQAAGVEVDLLPIAIKILDRAEDTALLRTSPQASKQLIKIAEDLVRQGDKVDILEAERIKQFLNAELSDAFGATDLSKQAKEGKKLITRELGTQLDQKLSDLPAEFKELKIKYGALSSIEDDVLKRVIVFERRNPEGLADILNKTEAAALIAFGGPKQKLQAIARLTVGRQLKKANDADDLIRRAFEKIRTGPTIEKAKNL